jgi:hypothetical protein
MARWNRTSQIGEIAEPTEIREQPDTSLAPDTEVEQKIDASVNDLGFRPLTEKEKKAFVDSLDADGKRILRELAGERGKSTAKERSAGLAAAVIAPAFDETT